MDSGITKKELDKKAEEARRKLIFGEDKIETYCEKENFRKFIERKQKVKRYANHNRR